MASARGLGLAGRMLGLTLGFAMLAQLVIYPVAVANFRDNWLGDRLASAHTAAMLFEEAPKEAMNEALAMSLLDSVGAQSISLRMGGATKMLALKGAPPTVAETYDLRRPRLATSIAAALRALTAAKGTEIAVKGDAPMGGEFVEVALDETPLVDAMRAYSWRLLVDSLAVSAIVALLAAGAIDWLILRPVRRLTSSLIAFGADP
ncbi:MAG: sensor histidine kinase, partial [Hyphomicrobiales bacterium]|nr:sensor histidine kinase [Hyphomicrobiales bacterium]